MPKPLREPEKGEERRGNTAMIKEMERLRREIFKYRGDILRLERGEERLWVKCGRRDNRIEELEQKIAGMRSSWAEIMEAEAGKARTVQKRLKQTEELLETRTAELSGAQAFLSTADRLSEMEVLSIVRDLNENIYQVAVSLTEEWEKLEPPQATARMNPDPTPQPRVHVLVQLARNRDLTGLTYLLQLHLCYQAMNMTSSWARNPDLGTLKQVYQSLSASGEHHIINRVVCNLRIIEGQAISARWRSLTHTYLSAPPPDSTPIMELLARVLDETGLSSSREKSSEFVRTVALERIESMIRTAKRLESAFMVDITSSNMGLLFENPGTLFDEARMTNEFGSDSAFKPGRGDKIAGMTEVGVEKSVCGGPGEARRAEILLKPRVVLERDAVGDGK
jgi:N-acyl-L-homoserine lactone synthetase